MPQNSCKCKTSYRRLIKLLIDGLLLLGILQGSLQAQTVDFTEQELNWIEAHPSISVGIFGNWPPIDFYDKNAQHLGITRDYLDLISSSTGIHIEAIAVNDWNQMLEKAIQGEIDIVATLAKNTERQQHWHFTQPYFKYPYVIATRKATDSYKNLGALYGKTVAVEKGFFLHNDFTQKHPQIKLLLVDNTAQALQAVSREQADAYVGNQAVIFYLLEQLRLTNMKVTADAGYPTGTLHFAIRKNWPELVSIIDKILQNTPKQHRQEIERQWLGLNQAAPATLNTSAKPELSNREIQWLAQHPEIKIGVDGNWPPIDFFDEQQQHSGISAEYLKLLEKKLGIRFIPQKSDSFKLMLQKVIDGKLAVGSTISFNQQRSQQLLFTQPYFHVKKVILTRKGRQNIKKITDLYGKTVAIEDGFLTMHQLKQQHPDIQLIPVQSTQQALEKVSWGEADAYIGNQAVSSWIIRKQQLVNLTIIGDAELGEGPQNFAISKNAPQWFPLVNILDKALDSITTEEKLDIEKRWLAGSNINEDIIPELELTQEQKDWLQQLPEINIGVDAKWQPLEYIDEQGNYQGLSSDYIKYFAGQMGVTVKPPQEMPWSNVLNSLKNKSLDLAPLIIKTPERTEYLNFTKPYHSFPFVIFNQRGETLLGGLTDLINKNVGMVEGYAMNEFIRNDYPRIRQVEFSDTLSGLEALSTGKIDAFIDVLPVGGYLLAANGMSNLQVAASTPYLHDFSIGIRKDWPQMVDILNQAIEQIPVSLRNEFLRKWLVVNYQQKTDYTLLFWVLAIASTILILLAFRAREMSRVNAQLHESRERQALTLESAELGTFEIKFPHHSKPEFRWDETFATHHNLPSGPVEIKTSDDFYRYLSPKYIDHIKTELIRYVKGETQQFKVEYQTREDKKWISSLGRIFERDEKGWAHRIVGISQDITQRKEANKAIIRSSQFKSQFLANMSHEIRTPMNAIVGLAFLLLRTRLNKKQTDYVSNLQKSAKILLSLIDDILDFSKIEAGHLRIDHITFNLEELLNDLADLTVIRIADNDVEFIYDMGPDIPMHLIGDSFRLNQVLNNLVSNAIKFTEKGNIILKVNLEDRYQDSVWLLFTVIDTGIGISKEKLNNLFEPFIQEDGSTTRKYGGTGLGLSISKQLTQLMGGELQAKSEKGKGSQFFFRLPFKLTAEEEIQPSKRSHIDLQGMKILLVDDNPISLKVLSATLKALKFKVTSVISGEQAIEKLNNNGDKFDLVLLDWRMPEMDGVATAHEIKQQLPKDKLPLIILMTAYAKDAVEQEIENQQLDGFLIKPITPSPLFNAIIQAQKNYSNEMPPDNQTHLDKQTFPPLIGHVILAEDNPINQQVAHEILLQMGVLVSVCENGTEVLELLEAHTPDLILMDIQMPELDGYQTTRRIRSMEQYSELPVIAMTANAMKEDVEKSLAAGMQGHISKPVDPELLYQHLCDYLEQDARQQNDDKPEYHKAIEDKTDLSWPETIAGLNIKQGIKQVGGNEKLYRKLLNEFLHNYRHLAQDLKQYIIDNEDELAARATHTIKGVSGNIGADRLHQIASEIDLKINHSETIADDLFDEFTKAFNELCDSLHHLTSDFDTAATQHAESNKLTDDDLTLLIQALTDSDASSRQMLAKFASAIQQRWGDNTLQQISQLVSDYEFERAANLVTSKMQEQNQ